MTGYERLALDFYLRLIKDVIDKRDDPTDPDFQLAITVLLDEGHWMYGVLRSSINFTHMVLERIAAGEAVDISRMIPTANSWHGAAVA